MQSYLLNTQSLCEKVRLLGHKHEYLAMQAGVSRRTLQRWMSGATKKILMNNAKSLAKAIGCKVDDLIVLSREVTKIPTDLRFSLEQALQPDYFKAMRSHGLLQLYDYTLKTMLNQCISEAKETAILLGLCKSAQVQRKLGILQDYAQYACESVREKEPLARFLTYLGYAHFRQGSLQKGRNLLDASIEIGNEQTLGESYSMLSLISRDVRHLSGAVTYGQKSLEYCSPGSIGAYGLRNALNYLYLGEKEAAMKTHSDPLVWNNPTTQVHMKHLVRAEILMHLDELNEAEKDLALASELMTHYFESDGGFWQKCQGLWLSRNGQYQESNQLLKQAAKFYQGMPSFLSEILLHMSRNFQNLGNASQARYYRLCASNALEP